MFKFYKGFSLAFLITLSSFQLFCPGKKGRNFSRVKLGDLPFLNQKASVSKDSLGRTLEEAEKAVESAREALSLLINGCSRSPEQRINLENFINSDLFTLFYREIFSPIFFSVEFENLLQGWLCEKFGIYSYIDSKGVARQYFYRGILINGKGLLFSDKTCQKLLISDFFVALKFHCLSYLVWSRPDGCQRNGPYKLVLEIINSAILPCLEAINVFDQIPDYICDLFKSKIEKQLFILKEQRPEFFSLCIDFKDAQRWNTQLASCLLIFLDNAGVQPFIPEKDKKLNWTPTFLDSPMVHILADQIS